MLQDLNQTPLQCPHYDLQCRARSALTSHIRIISKRMVLRLDNTGAGVMEVNPSLLGNPMTENVDLYIKLRL